MAYEILLFDGLEVPTYLKRGDSQNMGTGSALIDYLQLPGEGFYDSRRGKRAPQGIRPVTKSGVMLSSTAAGLRALVDSWRAKIGVRGKLTVRFFDGSLRWQWARLQDVDIPISNEIKGNWAPFTFTWQTAAQWWYGHIYRGGWTWGDGSWVFGDGTAVFGEDDYTWDLSSTSTSITVNHAGNLRAKNLRIEIDRAVGSAITPQIWNLTTGQVVTPSGSSTAGTLVLDAGSREAYQLVGTSVNIVNIWGVGTTLVVESATHGLSTGDHVQIAGTENYDGTYYNITVSSSTVFTAPIDPESLTTGAQEVATGTVTEILQKYSGLSATDRKNWMSLAPGDNDIVVSSGASMTGSTITFKFYDHWA